MTPRTTRRRFLHETSAAVLAAGVWSAAAPTRAKGPNEKLNIGCIGLANRGETNVIGVSGENIVALCDVDERYVAERGERHPDAAQFVDFRKLLEHPGLDAVVVSTPDHTHCHAAMLAMRRGLHVYCEKPLAHSIHEVRRMARLAKEKKIVTQTGIQHHRSDGYRRAVAMVREGELGEVREVHSWTNMPFWPQGIARPAPARVPPLLHWDLWLGPAPQRPFADGYHPMNWRGFWDFGTGALGDRGPHLIDPAFEALQLGAPKTIAAESSAVTEESAPEWSIVTFEFPARGALPPVKLIWYDGQKQPPREVTGAKGLPPNGTLLVGSRAKLFIPELGGQPIPIVDGKANFPPPKKTLAAAPDHYAEWIAACKTGGATSCDFAYGTQLTELCLLGNIALRAGRKLEWDAESLSFPNCPAANRYLRREYRRGWELDS